MMNTNTLVRLATLILALVAPFQVQAMQYAIPETWGGDLLSRPRLTGDWGGLRDAMAKKGVVLDLDAYWTPQTITGGGKNQESGS